LGELGVAAEELRLVGGGSKSSLWRQIVADVTGLRVSLPAESESAALGGALQSAALGSGQPFLESLRAVEVATEEEPIVPRAEAGAAYGEALERHLERARVLFG
jgi:xylulokinase